ncbi:MAG: bifunctional phosphopantothenoylcysteine decarboxylase/phosphopantothenate--cysteine ligase CoaBC [Chloroflexi bacterium]|nr:bifunctional phosphopantothenoylcysteine decarboxylase/phosphopantothenate--cysteine ligase CoaBC [Chloroflexota bacterium]
MNNLQGKHIVLGVTGSIAAYKAVDLASKLTQAGAVVDVIMSHGATEMVTPLSFQVITHRPVITQVFSPLAETEIGHVTLAKQADVFVIAPATAHVIARLALGLADDMITTTALATPAPMLIAPAMESHMFEHPATQQHLATLRARGAAVMQPGTGHLASGAQGVGRLPDPAAIVEAIRQLLGRGGDLHGRRVVITAGGTQEALDPVRYLTNHSSGKMGFRLAEAARDRGAEAVIITAPSAQPTPYGVRRVDVVTGLQMLDAVMAEIIEADALVMAAAVADYRPALASTQKIKKSAEAMTLELTRNPDILKEVAAARAQSALLQNLVVVGFAAETENLLENGQKKLIEKNLDLVVANPVPESFAGDESQATFIYRDQPLKPFALQPKSQVADRVWDVVAARLRASIQR